MVQTDQDDVKLRLLHHHLPLELALLQPALGETQAELVQREFALARICSE